MRTSRAWWIGLGLIAGLVAVVLLVRRRGRRAMPHLAAWRRALGVRLGEAPAGALLANTQARYAALAANHPLPAHPALRHHLLDHILPGLALYQALRETAGQDEALAAVDAAFDADLAEARVLRLQMTALHWLPAPFAVFRPAARAAMAAYPAAGWCLEPVEDSAESYAFNMRSCFYLDTLRAYGAPELTPHFCRLDDLQFAQLPPSITWRRDGTLGRGDAQCDFRWSRATL